MSSTQPPPTELRELDAEVARKVMGWRDIVPCGDGLTSVGYPPGEKYGYGIVPPYSSSPAAMDELIGKLTHDWGVVTVLYSDAPHYSCEIEARDGSIMFKTESEVSAAQAVCLAALKAAEHVAALKAVEVRP